jgi:hypothetical protein
LPPVRGPQKRRGSIAGLNGNNTDDNQDIPRREIEPLNADDPLEDHDREGRNHDANPESGSKEHAGDEMNSHEGDHLHVLDAPAGYGPVARSPLRWSACATPGMIE